MKNFRLLIVALFCTFWGISSIYANVPQGYYTSAEMKSGGELKTALHQIIKVGKRLNYGSGDGSTWWGFSKSDRHPEGHVWDMYSDDKVPFNGYSAASGMNIEHSFAKSWWGGTKNNAYKDLYHLNPSNSRANSARSSYPPGEVKNGSTTGTIKVGTNNFGDYTGKAFEPVDEYKGDFARAYMYMVVCYQDLNLTASENSRAAIQSDASYKYTFKPWFKELMLKWHRNDPVSQKEINRQEAIYSFQENRNPFIDYPEIAEYLWGSMVGEIWTTTGSVTDPYVSQPYMGSIVNFTPTPVYTTISDTIIVKARNLDSNLSVSITGADALAFKATTNTINKTHAESDEGAMVIVKFTANSLDEHNATFTISGGGIKKNIEVYLKGKGTNDFLATEATNVTKTGFTANWSIDFGATDYSLNVYTFIDNGVVGEKEVFNATFSGKDFPSNIDRGNGYLDHKDGALKMGSGSQGGTIMLDAMDLSNDNVTITVNAKKYNNDSQPTLYFKVGEKEIGSITTDKEYESQTINIGGNGKNAVVSISVLPDKRVYIKDIVVVDEGNVLSRDTLEGYPKNVGDVRSYDVSVPNGDNNYYYEVTSIGGSKTTTNSIKVVLGGEITGNESVEDNNNVVCYSNHDNIVIEGLVGESFISIYSINGRVVGSYTTYGNSNISTTNLTSGIYLINIINDNISKTIKILIR